MSIQNIYISDHEEQDRVLEVGVSGDLVFLSVGTFDPGYAGRTFTPDDKDKSLAVPVADLMNALIVAGISQERDDLVRDLGTDLNLRAAPVR